MMRAESDSPRISARLDLPAPIGPSTAMYRGLALRTALHLYRDGWRRVERRRALLAGAHRGRFGTLVSHGVWLAAARTPRSPSLRPAKPGYARALHRRRMAKSN